MADQPTPDNPLVDAVLLQGAALAEKFVNDGKALDKAQRDGTLETLLAQMRKGVTDDDSNSQPGTTGPTGQAQAVDGEVTKAVGTNPSSP